MWDQVVTMMERLAYLKEDRWYDQGRSLEEEKERANRYLAGDRADWRRARAHGRGYQTFLHFLIFLIFIIRYAVQKRVVIFESHFERPWTLWLVDQLFDSTGVLPSVPCRFRSWVARSSWLDPRSTYETREKTLCLALTIFPLNLVSIEPCWRDAVDKNATSFSSVFHRLFHSRIFHMEMLEQIGRTH